MNKFRRFTTFFKIQPGEERVTGLLVLLYFALALAYVLIQSMAFGVFIAEYGPEGLPYSYIVVAIFASLAAFFYIKLGERVPFSTSLMLNLVFLVSCSFLVWLGLKSLFSHYFTFILPLLFQIVINFGNLVVWPLAECLFNFQQAKRLFPLLSAGYWLANITGGLLVPPLVRWVSPTNLLLPATASVGLAMLALRVITRAYLSQEPPKHQTRRSVAKAKRSAGFLQDRYVLLIFGYVIFRWMAFYFVHNIFADRAAAQFPDVNQLTAFMGQLLSITGIVALISSTFLTGRILRRFGLRVGLAGMPLLVTLAIGALAITGNLGGTLVLLFGLSALAKSVNVALNYSLSPSADAIIYRSLPETVRGRVQATAVGIVKPVAIGLAGISLVVLITGLKFDYLGLSYVFLGLAAGWLIVIFLLSGDYVSALTQAITKRRLGESPTVLSDPASVALLQSRLHDPHPGAAIYALTKLDELDPRAVARALPELIQHPAPEVRREVFSRIETLQLRTALDGVSRQLSVETDPSAKESALRSLGAISDPDAASQLSEALAETNPYSLRGALIGSLKYQDMPAAEQALDRLLSSSFTADRILAAQALGEVERTGFQQAHQTLMRDPDLSVRREALQSAGKSRQPDMYLLLIEACDSPETSHAAAQALVTIGKDVFPQIETAFSQPAAPRQRLLTLARVLGHIGGSHAQALLRSRSDSPNGDLRSQILNALSECGYRVKDPSEIHTAIEMEVRGIAWACATQADLGDAQKTALLLAALRQSVAQARERVLLLLSFAFDAHSMLRVRDILFTDSASQLAYALEIIDTQLPLKWKPMIIPLFEGQSAQARLDRLAMLFPQAPQTGEDRLRTLICGSEEQEFTEWTRACAIYTAAQLNARACQESIRDAATEASRLIRDTARQALAKLSTDDQEGTNSMLSTIEKVLILKTVNMFSQTPDDVLADVANLLEEVDLAENETVFKMGEPGDSMYIIIDGKVRVHTDEHLLNYLGESDVFGEMALLDPEPRIASVTAVEPTRLFRLDKAPFYQLMEERPEVATGIIRVLTRRLRNTDRELSQLDNRIKELQHTSKGKTSLIS
jgi:CRP-like cAMP-binding protein/ATP/ADP translocase/HEAT repeat protein